MRPPREYALESERHPHLPPGTEERVSGYGVMGQTFASGHVLGLRRWTASSVGEQFASIWHREPDGRWHFYESAQPEFACSRWFGGRTFESKGIFPGWRVSTVLSITPKARSMWI